MLEEVEYPKNAEKWVLIREIPPLSIIKCNDTPICKTKETFSKIISTLTGTESIIELNTICVLRVSESEISEIDMKEVMGKSSWHCCVS